MPGGGCVLLIPYLISRSRGEALNPKPSLLDLHRHAYTYGPPLLQIHKLITVDMSGHVYFL